MNKEEIKKKLAELYEKREWLVAKASIHDNTQLALKTLINGLYGAMGNEWFRFFDFYNAEAVTSTGQYSIQRATIDTNAYLNRITGTDKMHAIYNDTDSISLSLEAIIEKLNVNRDHPSYIDTLCKFADTKLNAASVDSCARIAKSLNVFENKLSFKREKVFTSGLYVAKKRYALLVNDSEGVRFSSPKVKITGLEIKRSDTPLFCRDALKEGLMMILTKTEPDLQKFIKEFEQKFNDAKPAQIATPSGVNGLKKYHDPVTVWKTKAPGHVKASLIFNLKLKEFGIDGKYPSIDEGNKMKTLKLRLPNPVKYDVIGFLDVVPPEFGIEKYIDRKRMLEENFGKAMGRMTEAAGWKMVESATIDDWF